MSSWPATAAPSGKSQPLEKLAAPLRPSPDSAANMTKLGRRGRGSRRYRNAEAYPSLCGGKKEPPAFAEADGSDSVRNVSSESDLVRGFLVRPVAPFGHELVELSTVASETQALEKLAEFPLLVLKAPQRIGLVFVEGTVAARG